MTAAQHPDLEPIPGIGVCRHDLRFLACAVTRAFGMNGTGASGTEAEIISCAINQATFDLEAIAEALGENHEQYQAVLNVRERLFGAAETAPIFAKLFANIPSPDGGR